MKHSAPAVLALALLLVGCGSSNSSPRPTATAGTSKSAFSFHSTRQPVSIEVRSLKPHATYALLKLAMRNNRNHTFTPNSLTPLNSAGFITPLTHGSLTPCDADLSLGTPLAFTSLPPHATTTGWIRCDYPKGSTVLVLFWEGRQVGGYKLTR